MLRLLRRAGWLLLCYVGVIVAVVAAGFFGGKFGIWASVLWGMVVIAGVAVFIRRRAASRPRS
jgi:hypothetical protein